MVAFLRMRGAIDNSVMPAPLRPTCTSVPLLSLLARHACKNPKPCRAWQLRECAPCGDYDHVYTLIQCRLSSSVRSECFHFHLNWKSHVKGREGIDATVLREKKRHSQQCNPREEESHEKNTYTGLWIDRRAAKWPPAVAKWRHWRCR